MPLKDPTAAAAYLAKYRLENAARIKEQKRLAYSADAENLKAVAAKYRNEHKEELLAKKREKYAANKEVFAERNRANRAKADKQEVAAYAKAWREANPDKVLAHARSDVKRGCVRKCATGHTPEYFTAKLEEQGGKCGLCPRVLDPKARTTHADHCHTTGKPRGVLCNRCNVSLGYAEKQPEFFIPAPHVQTYIDRYRAEHNDPKQEIA